MSDLKVRPPLATQTLSLSLFQSAKTYALRNFKNNGRVKNERQLWNVGSGVGAARKNAGKDALPGQAGVT
jgi:hypothetical protein